MKDKDTELLGEAYKQIKEDFLNKFRKDVQSETKKIAIKELYNTDKEKLINFLKQNINEEDKIYFDMLLNGPNTLSQERALEFLAKYIPNKWLTQI